jgi:hypothetical protein
MAAVARSGRRGIAELSRFVGEGSVRLAAGPVRPIDRSARGSAFGRYDQLLVVEISGSAPLHTAADVLDDFLPADDQLVAALVLGIGASAGQWSATLSEYGARRPVDSVRFVGPGMVTLNAVDSSPLTEPDERWSRTRGALGDAVFRKVRQSCVGVIGASRNGSVAATSLAMLGVAGLVLIDPDREEPHHVSATLGSAPGGPTSYKVDNRAAALRRIRPDLSIEVFHWSFPNRSVEAALADVDLVCTCVDRDLPRLAAAEWCAEHAVCHLDVGTGIFPAVSPGRPAAAAARTMGADIRLCLPRQSCLVCLGGLTNLEESRRLLRSPPGTLPSTRRLEWHEARSGSLVTVNSTAVNLGLEMWLDLMSGHLRSSTWLRLEWSDQGIPLLQARTPALGPCQICGRVSPKPD